jgi:predicted nucleic acid-binding protein
MILDSSAWMEYFMGTDKGKKVKQLVESSKELHTSPIILAEIYSKSIRIEQEAKARQRVEFVLKRTSVIEVNEKIGIEAGSIHAEGKQKAKDFGLADALILASARSKKVKVLTSDRHLKFFDSAELL